MRRILFLFLTIALLATACSNDDPVDTSPDTGEGTGDTDPLERNDDGEVVIDVGGDELVLTSGLSGFGDCDALLDHLRTEAAERVGPWGFDGGGWYGPVFARGFDEDDMAEEADFATADGEAVQTSANDAAAPVEGVDFSGTNVQEIGVDEADIIKTDGERVYVVAGNQLVVVDAVERTVIGTVDVPQSWQSELFLAGDELLLISSSWLETGISRVAESSGDAEAAFAEDAAIDIAEPWFGSNAVRITRISIDGDGDPDIEESIVIEGDYVSSRAIDGTARVILRSNPQQNFPFVYPQSEAGEDIARDANQAAVRQSELTDWLPSYGVENADGSITSRGILPDCSSVHAPTEFAGFGILSVVSVPVGGSIDDKETTSVLAPGSTVYASTESIFVATQTWPDPVIFEDAGEDAWQRAWENRRTSIHRFALSDTGAAYTASGDVAGDLRNQFSLSEHEGHLRVVTTTGDVWDETSESWVRVLREVDGELVEVGSVGDMGNGEAVQSVRFVGDVGYVVTFRQIDPFYTLDLTDPENPRVVGELKIPGFSSYLHPIGEGRVLGVGSDADLDGRVTGSKVSIFDVSDPANPEEVAIWSAPNSWNDVGWEHRSFLWWEAEQMAVIPMSLWDEGFRWSGAIVLKVDGTTISEVGRIDHIDDELVPGSTECDTLSSEDLPSNGNMEDFTTELEYMLADGYGLLLLCDEGESRTAAGFDCYEEEWLLDEAERLDIVIPADTAFVMCWENGNRAPAISRTVVIGGDELWTLSSDRGWTSPESPGRLQINDLGSLDRLGHVEVG